jgi:hypothetical protein
MGVSNIERLKSYNYNYSYNIKRRDLATFKIGIQINCSQEKLWNLLRTPQHLKVTHPYCKDHVAKEWGIVGAVDRLIFNNDNFVNRTLIEMDDHFFILSLIQDEKKENDIKVKFEAHKLLDDKCELYMTVSVDSFKKIPRPIWWLYSRFKIVPSYDLYISSVIKGYKYYLETGKSVKKNQFGYHPDYSVR